MKFIVLGGYGIIGKAVVRDLFKFSNGEIIIAGRDLEKAEDFASSFKSKRVKAKQVNINNEKELVSLLKKGDVCVNCVQYYFNLFIMKACIKARINYVDLGGLFHYTKKQLAFHEQFKKIGKTAILGIGGAPGISNVLALYGARFLDKINDVEIVFADKDYTQYKQKFVLPYSFKTIIDEYIMKPAVFQNGKTLFLNAGSGIKEYNFPDDFGKQKGFLTLHSEIVTLPLTLKDKGIRNCEFRVTFPDSFSEIILKLIELGFASKEKVEMSGKQSEILEITAGIMDKLIPKEGVKINDKELIRVIFNNGELIIDALTESDGKTSAGVLDTGIPCSIASIMLALDKIEKRGVLPPEIALNADDLFEELAKRKIKVMKNGKKVN